jgi:hypothetical protein
MSFYAIGQSLKSVLNTVQSAPSSRLAVVYDYDSPETGTGYPYATLTPKGAEEESLDTATNQTLYSFVIRCQDVQKDKSTMEATMRRLCDDILAELRKASNITFGGSVDRVLPFTVSWGWDTANQIPSRFFEIEVQVLRNFQI